MLIDHRIRRNVCVFLRLIWHPLLAADIHHTWYYKYYHTSNKINWVLFSLHVPGGINFYAKNISQLPKASTVHESPAYGPTRFHWNATWRIYTSINLTMDYHIIHDLTKVFIKDTTNKVVQTVCTDYRLGANHRHAILLCLCLSLYSKVIINHKINRELFNH